MKFTFNEYADKDLMYGFASCNALKSQMLSKEHFSKRRIHERKTFEILTLKERGKS